jgi:ABC-2 type transport system permease protein
MKSINSFKAVFKKQLKDFIKNPAVLIQFAMFPFIAFIINILLDFDSMTGNVEMPNIEGMTQEMATAIATEMTAAMESNVPNLTIMQANMFAGMALIPVVAGFIAEDIETKRLRFLMMAGVKPAPYLLGIGGVVFLISFFTSVAFSLIGGFGGTDFFVFTAAMMSGVAGSIVLGATIGILTKNQQTATALAMPAALVLGFGPMLAQFNESIARGLHIFYTQQLNIVADSLNGVLVDAPLWQSFVIMWVNVAVLCILFTIVYVKKGLKE